VALAQKSQTTRLQRLFKKQVQNEKNSRPAPQEDLEDGDLLHPHLEQTFWGPHRPAPIYKVAAKLDLGRIDTVLLLTFASIISDLEQNGFHISQEENGCHAVSILNGAGFLKDCNSFQLSSWFAVLNEFCQAPEETEVLETSFGHLGFGEERWIDGQTYWFFKLLPFYREEQVIKRILLPKLTSKPDSKPEAEKTEEEDAAKAKRRELLGWVAGIPEVIEGVEIIVEGIPVAEEAIEGVVVAGEVQGYAIGRAVGEAVLEVAFEAEEIDDWITGSFTLGDWFAPTIVPAFGSNDRPSLSSSIFNLVFGLFGRIG